MHMDQENAHVLLFADIVLGEFQLLLVPDHPNMRWRYDVGRKE